MLRHYSIDFLQQDGKKFRKQNKNQTYTGRAGDSVLTKYRERVKGQFNNSILYKVYLETKNWNDYRKLPKIDCS
jgi:hypothetical protein